MLTSPDRFMRLVCLLTTSGTWAQHAELLAATPAAQHAIVELSLRCCLPRLLLDLTNGAALGTPPPALYASHGVLPRIGVAMRQPALADGLGSMVLQLGAAALVQQAA